MEIREALTVDNETLRKMQLLELGILKEIDAVCRKHGLRYTLCGGSMLGAIRHGGIIPWDDDIDVTMLRDDYDRFFEVCKTELDADKYFVQTMATDPDYRLTYGRILLKGTKFVRVGQEHIRARNGLFVDIFPRDGKSDFFLIRKLQSILAKFMRKILYSPVGARRSKSMPGRWGFRVLRHFPRKSALHILNVINFLNLGKKTERVVCWGLMSNKERRKLEMGREAYKAYKKKIRGLPPEEKKKRKERDRGICREWFYQIEDLPFEDMEAMVTSAWDTWLTWNYDDYMKLPPVEKRKIHQTVSQIDFGGYA
ncbi:MAG: LicD family protein [Lachnospiraceae bacterium]|nr:LicD family protein [Lachnospiraceae bacterium]